MEYWIPRDAAQLKSQLWRIASTLSVHWPQNTPLKVQNVQKFTAFVKSVVFFSIWDLIMWPEMQQNKANSIR